MVFFFSFPFHYFTLIVIYSFKKISRIQEPDPCISMDEGEDEGDNEDNEEGEQGGRHRVPRVVITVQNNK